MLDTKNIISNLETKATAKLPITEKQMEFIIKKFRRDMIKALNELWSQSGNVIKSSNIGSSILMNTIDFGIGDKLSKTIDKWRDDMLIPIYGSVVIASGNMTSTILSDTIDKITQFSITSQRVQNYIDSESLSMVVQLERNEIDALRSTLRWGFENNIRSDRVKDLMVNNVSLTKREADATLRAYSREYDRQLQIGLDKGMTKKRATDRALRIAEKVRNRQYKRYRNARTERIYRTEISRLKHFSDIESLNQAQATGKIEEATKTWRRTGFNDNWQSSISNDGVTVGVNEPFPVSCETGNADYPSEINERCVLEYGIKYKKRGI